MKSKGFVNWSGGKDALLALYYCITKTDVDVDHLFSVVNAASGKNALHEVSSRLLKAQAEALGHKLSLAKVPDKVDNKTYQRILQDKWNLLMEQGYRSSVFGDIFLEDVRSFKEEQFKDSELKPVFPLWKKPTDQLAKDFIGSGFKAIIITCEASTLDSSFCGREFDQGFLNDLPDAVDPCGENGEFHTFCYDGPIFRHPVQFDPLEIRSIKFPSPSGGSKGYKIWNQRIE